MARFRKIRTAAERLQAILPLLDYWRQRLATRAPVILPDDPRPVRTLEEAAARVAARHGISPRTVFSWLRYFRQGGYDGLADPRRSDSGYSRHFFRYSDQAAFVQKQPPRKPTLRILAAMRREGFSPLPCYATLRSYLQSLKRAAHAARLARRRAKKREEAI